MRALAALALVVVTSPLLVAGPAGGAPGHVSRAEVEPSISHARVAMTQTRLTVRATFKYRPGGSTYPGSYKAPNIFVDTNAKSARAQYYWSYFVPKTVQAVPKRGPWDGYSRASWTCKGVRQSPLVRAHGYATRTVSIPFTCLGGKPVKRLRVSLQHKYDMCSPVSAWAPSRHHFLGWLTRGHALETTGSKVTQTPRHPLGRRGC